MIKVWKCSCGQENTYEEIVEYEKDYRGLNESLFASTYTIPVKPKCSECELSIYHPDQF